MKSFPTRYLILNSKWFLEHTTEYEGSFHSLKEIIYSGISQYQSIDIVKTGSYGKCLILDGKIQSSEADEFIYHEALIHPALILHDAPKKILIGGGGEGAAVREALKHTTVSEVTVVDLDREVVELCRQHLHEWHRGAFEDGRVKIFFEDARKFINKSNDYDVVILDLPEPYSEGPALMLYTKEFYNEVYRCLKDDGILITQATSASVHNFKAFTSIANTLKQVFPFVNPYIAHIPSFYARWGFVMASKKFDLAGLTAVHIEQKISALTGELKFYDSETHTRIFSLPKYLRSSIEKEEQIISDSSPISFY